MRIRLALTLAVLVVTAFGQSSQHKVSADKRALTRHSHMDVPSPAVRKGTSTNEQIKQLERDTARTVGTPAKSTQNRKPGPLTTADAKTDRTKSGINFSYQPQTHRSGASRHQ